ncbi:MAG: DUF4388 domain-containing protein [Candidatus Nanopelagicales bacterium]
MSVESSSQDRSLAAEPLLRELDRPDTSGVLEISHPGQDISHVWFRQGGIYAMQVPGYRPALGVRLLSGGLVAPEQLSQAAAEQREHLHPQRIGEVLVARGQVSAEVVAAFVHEQVLDQLADLLDLEVLGARFHPGRRIRQDVIPPTPVDDLLAAARQWRARRVDALRRVGGAGVIPHLRPPGQGSAQTPLGPDDWALLCRVDGRRSIGELARVCGFTLQQAAQIVADLTLTSVLALPEPSEPEPMDLAPVRTLYQPVQPDPQWEFDGSAAGEPEPLEATPCAPAASAELPAAPELPQPPDAPSAPPSEFAALALVTQTEEAPRPASAAPPAQAPEPPAQAPAPAAELPAPPAQAPPQSAPETHSGEDTSVFMRELSSLSDDPDRDEPIVTRLVVPLTEERRRRRRWGR